MHASRLRCVVLFVSYDDARRATTQRVVRSFVRVYVSFRVVRVDCLLSVTGWVSDRRSFIHSLKVNSKRNGNDLASKKCFRFGVRTGNWWDFDCVRCETDRLDARVKRYRHRREVRTRTSSRVHRRWRRETGKEARRARRR